MTSAELDALYPSREAGFVITAADRARIESRERPDAATYGEITDESARRLLTWLRLSSSDRFVDLGSGRGRLCLRVAVSSPAGSVLGIELSAERHQLAKAALIALRAQSPEPAGRLAFQCEDLTQSDLRATTVAYMGSTCFTDAMMSSLATSLAEAHDLRLILSTKVFPGSAAARFEDLGTWDLPMTWGPSVPLFLYRPKRASGRIPDANGER